MPMVLEVVIMQAVPIQQTQVQHCMPSGTIQQQGIWRHQPEADIHLQAGIQPPVEEVRLHPEQQLRATRHSMRIGISINTPFPIMQMEEVAHQIHRQRNIMQH